jgi:hypothetical protein
MALGIGQDEVSDQRPPWLQRRGQDRGIDIGHVQLGCSEEGEGAIVCDRAPAQVETIAARLAMDEGAAKTESAITAGPHGDIAGEVHRRSVAGRDRRQMGRSAETDVDILIPAAGWIWSTAPTGQVHPVKLDTHSCHDSGGIERGR